ncbi:MAG: alpha/beta hydrolase [Ekhidna sp.]
MRIYLALFLLVVSTAIFAQDRPVFKIIGPDSLIMDIYQPAIRSEKKVPAMVFYFGGGWSGWNFDKFRPHAEYFSKRGLVTILVDYRVGKKHGTSPAASLRDAKSALRYVRSNAENLGIDPDKIIACGGSAGGHLAAACAVIEGFNEPSDDLKISCIPNALVLFNPVIDNGPGGYGYERVQEYYREFSPLHNLNSMAPPTLFMVGTNDRHVPVETAEYYQRVMERMGLRCDLNIYEGEKHGFFNYHHFDMYKETLLDTDEFLQSLGYLDTNPKIKIE